MIREYLANGLNALKATAHVVYKHPESAALLAIGIGLVALPAVYAQCTGQPAPQASDGHFSGMTVVAFSALAASLY